MKNSPKFFCIGFFLPLHIHHFGFGILYETFIAEFLLHALQESAEVV